MYLQNILGYSALQTGVQFLPFSGAVFVAAALAGRASARVPIRWLIAPGEHVDLVYASSAAARRRRGKRPPPFAAVPL
jgi:hypothetical protein